MRQIEVDLRNTDIRSPVNGVVVQRNVELGQTVAASLQAPELFRIADDLLRIAIQLNIPVLAYGIRTDFQTVAFPGSRRLLEIAHSIEELKTICRCGRKAVFNGRLVDGEFTFDGDQVAIDGERVAYESLCGLCYLRESDGRLASQL